MSDLMRSVIDAIIPEGAAWSVAPGEDWDKLYDGIALNWATIDEFLAELSSTRDPALTAFLADLEKEFGVFTNPNLTEQQRRDQLTPVVFNRSSNGSVDAMQTALGNAGFTVQVHENSPAVDPAIFLDQSFQVVLGGGSAFLGRDDAFMGRVGGELLVNGEIFTTEKNFTSGLGTATMGDGISLGEYDDLIRTKIEYEVPADPGDWPLVFFVGGVATRDGSGALIDIELAEVPIEQEQEFKRIILKFKPMHSWAGLIVTYT